MYVKRFLHWMSVRLQVLIILVPVHSNTADQLVAAPLAKLFQSCIACQKSPVSGNAPYTTAIYKKKMRTLP